MDIEYDVKREARNQYIKYFKIWFIIVAVLLVVSAIKLIGSLFVKEEVIVRTNMQAPEERVYDEANVLSDSEEEPDVSETVNNQPPKHNIKEIEKL